MALEDRVHLLNEKPAAAKTVVYWMSRDQRCSDNWALLYAQKRAIEARVPLTVVFCLVPAFLGATMRQYGFMLRGLAETAKVLAGKNIGFRLLEGDPVSEIPRFIESTDAGLLVTDFDPLRLKVLWREGVSKSVGISAVEVDAHNIVPCRIASGKQEFAARTFRPRITGLLDRYLVPYPPLKKHPVGVKEAEPPLNWEAVLKRIKVDRSVDEVNWIKPGEKKGLTALRGFLKNSLHRYDRDRNDPAIEGQSGLSPWLHFGHLSAQRVALEVLASGAGSGVTSSILEEIVVRRELSDNFCHYNRDYDSTKGFPLWAVKTLDTHRRDPRPYLYSHVRLENAETHDPFWNAAQRQMVLTGKMHGYMRMYWAKKILEWTSSPEEAMEIAISLNDRYELDGRDPNGYTGIAWSIGGVHDRAWAERPVFGKVRYMNEAGLRRKFNLAPYIERYQERTTSEQ